MTSPANDTSELTAYALGELQAHQAGDIHRLLSECPAAISELEQIEAVMDALRQHAPVPQDRLNPDQRHAVLHPVQMPRRVAPMAPRPAARPTSHGWPILNGLLRAAAVVTLTGVAYWLGRQEAPTAAILQTAITGQGTAKPAANNSEAVSTKKTPSEPATLVTQANKSAVPAPPVDVKAEPPTVVKAPVLVVKAPEQLRTLPAPKENKIEISPATPRLQQASAPQVASTRPNPAPAFIATGRQDADVFPIRPAAIRPLPAKVNSKELLASPAPLQTAAKPAGEAKPRPGGEMYIHAWQAEVSSCPWNPSTRLLRVTIQIPPIQPSADASSTFPLQVAFDRRHVREFRRLCERHTTASSMETSGIQTVWYEFQPVSDEAVRTGRSIATITLEKGRFTQPSVGPFDGSKLAVLDRGLAWTSAREDFLFESAVVGFGMLLRGDHRSPSLNHEIILAVAEKSRGSDPSGERTRFIRHLQEARRAAGL